MLRKNEFLKVQETMRNKLGLNLVAVDASDRFLAKLAGVIDPETKRKIIGNEFISVFDDEAPRILKETALESEVGGPGTGSEAKSIAWLVQGTLYPDVIESSSVKGPSQTIKSHHNVGGLPADMKLKLIEPLRDLFKDEVRRIGRDLQMPEEILQRQPFPGPGLAVRILGEVTAERVALLQEADDIVVTEIKAAGLYQQIWQSFAVLLPVKKRRRHRRPAHLRIHLRHPRRPLRRRNDRRLGPAPLRSPKENLRPHHQRSPRNHPRRLRHHLETPGTIEWE